jgi:hypothetical protein
MTHGSGWFDTLITRMAKILDRIFGVFDIGPPFDPPFRFFAEEPVDRTRKSQLLPMLNMSYQQMQSSSA